MDAAEEFDVLEELDSSEHDVAVVDVGVVVVFIKLTGGVRTIKRMIANRGGTTVVVIVVIVAVAASRWIYFPRD